MEQKGQPNLFFCTTGLWWEVWSSLIETGELALMTLLVSFTMYSTILVLLGSSGRVTKEIGTSSFFGVADL